MSGWGIPWGCATCLPHRGRGRRGPSAPRRSRTPARVVPTRSRRARRCGWPSAPPTCSGPGRRPTAGPRRLRARRRPRGRPGGADRRRPGHVHLRAPRRRDPAARADARSSSRSCRRSRSAARSPASASSRRRSATACRTSRCVELDVLTGAGEVVTAAPDGEHADLFRAFPNSYGTLGYATAAADRARAGRAVRARCGTSGSTTSTRSPTRSATIVATPAATTASRSTSSTASCSRPTRPTSPSGAWADDGAGAGSATTPARTIYYRSIQQRARRRPDGARLPVALGHRLVLVLAGVRRAEPVGPPAVAEALAAQRRLLPAGRPREPAPASPRRLDRAARHARARAGGPGRRDPGRPAPPEFLRWFARGRRCGRSGCARCGCASPTARSARPGRSTRWRPARPTSTSASGATVADRARRRGRRRQPAIEAAVAELGGHKSLYSDAFYDREDVRPALRRRRPTRGRSSGTTRTTGCRPLREGGDTTMTTTQDRRRTRTGHADRRRGARPRWCPTGCRSASRRTTAARPGPADAAIRLHLRHRARAVLPAHRARRPRAGPGLRRRRPRRRRACTRATPTTCCRLLEDELQLQRPAAGRGGPSWSAGSGWSTSSRRRRRRRRRCRGGAVRSRACGTRKTRDAEAIQHHYDVSNTFYELVLGPSMTYTCAVLPRPRTRRWSRRRPTSTTWSPASSASSPGMRLLDVGCGWGGMVRHAARALRRHGARRHPVPRAGRPGRRRRSSARGSTDLAEVRHLRLPRRRARPASTRSARSG